MACVCALSFLQRFQQLQANKKKLDGYKGKVLWVEASVLLEKVDEAKSAHAKVEAELKEVKTQVRAKDAACKPLDDAKAKYETSLRKIHEQHKQADSERVKAGQKLAPLVEEQDGIIDKIASLDKQKDKKAKKVADAQSALDDADKKISDKKEASLQQDGRDPVVVAAELKQNVTTTAASARQAQEAAREHKSGEGQLRSDAQRAEKSLQDLNDAKTRKMNVVARGNQEAAQAAHWVEAIAPASVKDAVVGPLLMHIDVPEPSHQPLVEEAIGPKLAFSGFLAKSDDARNQMTQHVKAQKWKVNVYKNSEGAPAAAPTRPGLPLPHAWLTLAHAHRCRCLPPVHPPLIRVDETVWRDQMA